MAGKRFYKLHIFTLFLFAFCLLPSFYQFIETGHARGPKQDPILRIETGMHIAGIQRIAVDKSCTLMATGADDKTVRLWSLPDGRLIKTLRMPIGKGHEGKVFSVAISPDRKIIAAGGWDAQYADDSRMRVYLFDAITGRLIRRIGKATSVYNDLEFSKDGRYLGAVLGGRQGMRIWRTSDWSLVKKDTSYGKNSYGADFGPDNSFYTTSYDGHIRKYSGPGFRLTHKRKVKSGKEAFGISVDPTGRRVAIGYDDNSIVDVYRASDLSFSFNPDLAGINKRDTSLITVSWSADGRRLFAGGAYWDYKSRTRIVRVWDAYGRGIGRNVPGTENTIKGLAPCGSNMAIGASDPGFGILSANGKQKLLWRGRVKPDMRGKIDNHFTISPDGTRLRFGLEYEARVPVLFDVTRGSLVESPTPISGLYPPDTKGLKITNWRRSFKPKLNGRIIQLDDYEQSQSVAVRPDKQGFVVGAYWSVRAYDARGAQLWRFQTPGVAWGVNLTRNGQIMVATYGDGSIRWYRVSDGQLLLSLFIHAEDRRWVAWTPKGYYMASPGGEDLIGWHLNGRTWDEAPDFFSSSRFRDRFYRPDIVKQVLSLLDEDEAIYEANRLSKRKQEQEDIRKNLPPVINILNPGEGGNFSNPDTEIEYDLRSPSGLRVTKVDILLDGRPIDKSNIQNISFPATGGVGKARLKLPTRNVKIALIAHTQHATSEAARTSLTWKGAPPRLSTADINKPKLYALLIGVSNYQRSDYKLRYAAKDARDFAEVLKSQEGGVYREVVIKSLTDEQATAGNIRDALDWLESEVTSRDVGLLFLAGHGITDLKQRFYYLPYDGNPEKLRRTAIPQSDIQNVISSLAGKALMFIDACHSASSFGSTAQTRGLSLVDINGIVNELSSAENGVVMFASSTGRELSIEDSKWENGAFTEALLEGFNGKADYNGNSAISIAELDLWLSERVKQLTNKRQHPVARRPVTVPDFPIALARR